MAPYGPMGCIQKTAMPMASRQSGSPCAGNARQKKAYKAHFNPDWVKKWPAIIAKSHKGDTDSFCRLCYCDFSVSSGESKTCSVTSLIVTRCHHYATCQASASAPTALRSCGGVRRPESSVGSRLRGARGIYYPRGLFAPDLQHLSLQRVQEKQWGQKR